MGAEAMNDPFDWWNLWFHQPQGYFSPDAAGLKAFLKGKNWTSCSDCWTALQVDERQLRDIRKACKGSVVGSTSKGLSGYKLSKLLTPEEVIACDKQLEGHARSEQESVDDFRRYIQKRDQGKLGLDE